MFTVVEENFEFRGSDMVQNEGNKQEKNGERGMCEIPDKYRQKIQNSKITDRPRQIKTIPDFLGNPDYSRSCGNPVLTVFLILRFDLPPYDS